VVAQERASQPIAEVGIWAGGAVLDGYCLRRVEEDPAAIRSEQPARGEEEGADRDAELDRLDAAATAIAADLRSGASDSLPPGAGEATIAALDLLIGKGVERRLDHWRDAVDDAAWSELEAYMTWWVVLGYALRVAEQPTKSPAPAGVEPRDHGAP
jgi:hypothetical protein